VVCLFGTQLFTVRIVLDDYWKEFTVKPTETLRSCHHANNEGGAGGESARPHSLYFFGCDSGFSCFGAGICPCSLVGGTMPLILM